VIDRPSAKVAEDAAAAGCANTAQGAASHIDISRNDLNVRADCASENPTTSEV
jgi:hypothetical protein